MSAAGRPEPISDLLRRTIARAIQGGRTSYKALERETGVTRASILRFVRGSQSLRLDLADRLAAYFGLLLRPDRQSPFKPSRGKADP
jgi:plasmid maintenance system antidote protein VapI